MVRTPRCGRGNPGSNPGYGTKLFSFKNLDVFETNFIVQKNLYIYETRYTQNFLFFKILNELVTAFGVLMVAETYFHLEIL